MIALSLLLLVPLPLLVMPVQLKLQIQVGNKLNLCTNVDCQQQNLLKDLHMHNTVLCFTKNLSFLH